MKPYYEAPDLFAHTNPAFGATCLHWIAAGFARQAPERLGPLFPFAALGLSLLAADRTRNELPWGLSAKLPKQLDDHPHWREFATESIREWRSPFWDAVLLGAATGMLELKGSRLVAGKPPKDDPSAEAMKKRADTYGYMLAREDEESLKLLFGVDFE